MHKVGLLFNTQKKVAIEVAHRITAWGRNRGIEIHLPPHEASMLGVPATPDDTWRASMDFSIVIGGDGTFLRAARYVMGYPVPLYGINVGRLGFLAIGDPASAESHIESILEGNYSVEDRDCVKGTVIRNSNPIHELVALNDLVITKGSFARSMDLRLLAAGEVLSSFPADGLIVSSPTGSTAYALSAGGPIVPPHVSCMILAPICAHTLYARPMVIGPNDVVSILPSGDSRDILLTQDGQLGYELMAGDVINVQIDPLKKVKTIKLPGHTYYGILRKKLQWGSTSWGEGNGLDK